MNESLVAALEKALPKSLNDIVRRNQDRFEVREANGYDLAELRSLLYVPAPLPQIRAVIDNWRLILLQVDDQSAIYLQGYNRNERCVWMTSAVNAVDFEGMRVLTSNSLYELGREGEGEPTLNDLMHISYTFNRWGFGQYFDAPHVYY